MVVIAKPLKLKGSSKTTSETVPVKKTQTQQGKPGMTAAEIAHRAVQKRRLQDKVNEDKDPSYRQKVEKFNKRLASYSDHFDLQKTSD